MGARQGGGVSRGGARSGSLLPDIQGEEVPARIVPHRVKVGLGQLPLLQIHSQVFLRVPTRSKKTGATWAAPTLSRFLATSGVLPSALPTGTSSP